MRIDVLGVIIGGSIDGWFVVIKDDLVNTGGYLVHYSCAKDFSGDGFDDLFQTIGEVEQNFQFNNMSIKWME